MGRLIILTAAVSTFFVGGAWGEVFSEWEAIAVVSPVSEDSAGVDTEAALYELTWDTRANKVLDNGAKLSGRFTLRAQKDHPMRPGYSGSFPAGTGFDSTGAFSGLSAEALGIDAGPRARVEVAYVGIDGGYGELRVGRDLRVAARFFEGTPSVTSHSGSGSPFLDPSGLSTNRTLHDLTGPSAKISYATPRLLGLRLGVSATPKMEADGLDRRKMSEVGGHDISDALEVAANLSRTLRASRTRIEATLAYSTAAVEPFGRVETFSTGANVEFKDYTIGGSWLKSDEGLTSREPYEAWNVGVARAFSEWELSASYGQSSIGALNADGDVWSISAAKRFSPNLKGAVAYIDDSFDVMAGNRSSQRIVFEITLSGELYRSR